MTPLCSPPADVKGFTQIYDPDFILAFVPPFRLFSSKFTKSSLFAWTTSSRTLSVGLGPTGMKPLSPLGGFATLSSERNWRERKGGGRRAADAGGNLTMPFALSAVPDDSHGENLSLQSAAPAALVANKAKKARNAEKQAVSESRAWKAKAGGLKRKGAAICEHSREKRQRYLCKECGGSGICQHNRQKRKCKECGGSSICQHSRQKHLCKECGGSSICQHKRQKSRCKECGGAGLCQHKRQKSRCKECGGASLCPHHRIRSTCKECGGASICQHHRIRSTCKECGGAALRKVRKAPVKDQFFDLRLMTLQAMCADLALRVNDATDRSQLKAALADAATLAATSSNIKSGKAPKRILDRLAPSTLGFICSDWKLPPAGLKSGDYKSLARQVVIKRIQDACLTRPSLESAASTGHPPPSVAEPSSEDEGPGPPFEPAAYTPPGSSAASFSCASVAPFSSAEYTPSCPGSAGSHASDETYDVPCGPPPAWSLKYANRRGV